MDLPETFEVHYAWKDSEKAKVVIGSTVNGISTVDIPNVALEQRRTITAYIYLSGATEGETVNTIVLSVNKRKAPENFEAPEDVDLFHHTLAATAEYQRQAKESEKQAAARSADAEAWAHGREDHPDQEQDNAKYYAEQAAASQRAAELSRQMVSDSVTQARNDIGEAQQQAIKTITEQQGISIQKIKNQTAESEDNLKNTIRAAEQIKTDLDTEVENATPIKQGLDDSNTAAIKTKVDLDKSNTIADQIKAELEILNTTASKTKTNLDGANKTATDLTGTLESKISEGIQTKIDIQTTSEIAMSNLQEEATKQQEFIKTSIDDTLSISGKAADAAVTGKKIDSLKRTLSNKITKFYTSNQGETHLADSDNGKIMDMMIYGKSSRDGTPTIDNPVEIKSVVNPTVKVTNEDGLKVQSVTLNNITLNAIPVSSGGNVTIDGQQYTSDRVVEKDGVFGIERNIREIHANTKTMNNSEEYPGWNKVEGISDVIYYSIQLVGDSRRVTYISNFTQIAFLQNNRGTNNILYCLKKNIGYSQSELIAKAIDVDVYIRLQDAIFEPLPGDIQVKLQTFVTYYPVTNISVTSDQLDGYAVFNYPVSMANGWNYVKQQLNDNRDYIYDMDLQSAEAYVNSEYAVALTELEV